MEMEFKDTGRRRRFLLIAVGVALALAAAYGAFQLSQGSSQAPALVKETVLVAARAIQARTTITLDDVTMREVPIDEILPQSYRAADQVLGRVTSVPIYEDQQMTPNLFATTAADAEFSILGPDETVAPDSPYWRAVAIPIPKDRAVGGEVRAGQHVDLTVSVEIRVLIPDAEGNYIECGALGVTIPDPPVQCGHSTKISFLDIEVLKAMPDDDLYLFKVNLHQAEQIGHIIHDAPDSFTMLLRPDEDTRAPDTSQYGTTNDRVIMTYLYPAPQLIDILKLLGPSPYPYPDAPVVPYPGSSPIPGSPGGSPLPSASPPVPSPSPAP